MKSYINNVNGTWMKQQGIFWFLFALFCFVLHCFASFLIQLDITLGLLDFGEDTISG